KRMQAEIMKLLEDANRKEGNIYHMYRKPVWKHESVIMTSVCFVAFCIGWLVSSVKSIFR
ncbi:MAG TPA: hypothetical protein VK155_13405, partial [Bacteroidales bacterium]|nr:hypothetical protein [Bacteroidales bacterium]